MRWMLNAAVLAVLAGSAAGAQSTIPDPDRMRASLSVRDVPLRQAAERLVRSAQEKPGFYPVLVVDPNVADVPVTAHFRHATFPSGVRLLVYAGQETAPDLIASREGNFFFIRRRPAVEPIPPPPPVPVVDLNLERVPLKQALQQTFPNTHPRAIRALVEQDVPDVPVTVNVTGLSPEGAVRQIVAAAALQEPRITYGRGGRAFVVHLGPP